MLDKNKLITAFGLLKIKNKQPISESKDKDLEFKDLTDEELADKLADEIIDLLEPKD